MKNEETYCDKLLAAIMEDNQPMVQKVIDDATEKISKDITELVGNYEPVDYPLLIASMNIVLKGVAGTLSGSGMALVKFFEERMQAAIFTAPKEER